MQYTITTPTRQATLNQVELAALLSLRYDASTVNFALMALNVGKPFKLTLDGVVIVIKKLS